MTKMSNKLMGSNRSAVELHGCIVCARVFNILAVYTPDGWLLDCTVISPGGHIVPDDQQPLAACDTHTAGEIDNAYKRWKARNNDEVNHEQEDDEGGSQ
jgi:hypothetical protein